MTEEGELEEMEIQEGREGGKEKGEGGREWGRVSGEELGEIRREGGRREQQKKDMQLIYHWSMFHSPNLLLFTLCTLTCVKLSHLQEIVKFGLSYWG